LLLTGTPVQNSPKELISLLCFLMPALFRVSFTSNDSFGDKDSSAQGLLDFFVQEFNKEQEAHEKSNKKDADNRAYDKLKQLLGPFVLRRCKLDVLSQLLPPKKRKLEKVPFSEEIRTLYDSIISNHLKQKQQLLDPTCEGYSKKDQNIFTSLRKAANHPLLLRTRHTSTKAISDLSRILLSSGFFGTHATLTLKLVQNELESMSDFDIHQAALSLSDEQPHLAASLSPYVLPESSLFSSPKFKRLSELLPEYLAKNHRFLLFSQWTRCLDLIECLLNHINLPFCRLDGSTPIPERQVLIDNFNSKKDPSLNIFLLSTRAGGMGINLTSADICLLHDLDFNPFNDLQAEDRCHRIGQKKPVLVIKMVTEGTVDEQIYDMQERKKKMNDAILEDKPKGAKGKKKEGEEVKDLLATVMNQFMKSSNNNGVLANCVDGGDVDGVKKKHEVIDIE